MKWWDTILDLIASIQRISVMVMVMVIIVTGLYSCAATMLLCEPYTNQRSQTLHVPEECK